ncbi:MAG TPA: molybdopterin-guanine dinucleotide biosynthesis protein B [Thermoanaerobaculia bacterium]|nr:molybdopterin-guanine dinucleotide biosynthesis protein B [Thermoanaerobaculia bacterium]
MSAASGTLPATVGLVGPSGSGKTTLIERLLPFLAQRGLRVGVAKHHGHPIELDTEGKDTWRFRRAGASTTALVGGDQLAVFGAGAAALPFETLLATFYLGCELVLVEGFRAADQPSIVVARAPLPPDWSRPSRPIALAADRPDRFEATDPGWRGLPRFGLDDLPALAVFVAARVGRR